MSRKTAYNILRPAVLFTLVLFTFVVAQDGHPPIPDPFSPATAEPTKSTIVNNGTQTIRQFEVVPSRAEVRPITSDYEGEFFKEEDEYNWVSMKGSSHNIRAAYKLSSANGKNEFQAGFTEKIMFFDGTGNAAFNHIFSLKGRRYLTQKDAFNISSGAGADMIIYSKEITENTYSGGETMSPLGLNFGIDAIAQIFAGEQQIAGGILAQQSFVNEIISTDLGFAALWGMPISSRIAINTDLFYRMTLVALKATYDGGENSYSSTGYKKVDYSDELISTPHSLSIGATVTLMLTDLFGINAGYRTQLLIENYSSHTAIIGGRFAF